MMGARSSKILLPVAIQTLGDVPGWASSKTVHFRQNLYKVRPYRNIFCLSCRYSSKTLQASAIPTANSEHRSFKKVAVREKPSRASGRIAMLRTISDVETATILEKVELNGEVWSRIQLDDSRYGWVLLSQHIDDVPLVRSYPSGDETSSNISPLKQHSSSSFFTSVSDTQHLDRCIQPLAINTQSKLRHGSEKCEASNTKSLLLSAPRFLLSVDRRSLLSSKSTNNSIEQRQDLGESSQWSDSFCIQETNSLLMKLEELVGTVPLKTPEAKSGFSEAKLAPQKVTLLIKQLLVSHRKMAGVDISIDIRVFSAVLGALAPLSLHKRSRMIEGGEFRLLCEHIAELVEHLNQSQVEELCFALTNVFKSGDNSLMLSQTTSTLRQSSPLRRIVERLNKNLFSVLSSRASSILTHELESNDDDVDFLELDIIQSEHNISLEYSDTAHLLAQAILLQTAYLVDLSHVLKILKDHLFQLREQNRDAWEVTPYVMESISNAAVAALILSQDMKPPSQDLCSCFNNLVDAVFQKQPTIKIPVLHSGVVIAGSSVLATYIKNDKNALSLLESSIITAEQRLEHIPTSAIGVLCWVMAHQTKAKRLTASSTTYQLATGLLSNVLQLLRMRRAAVRLSNAYKRGKAAGTVLQHSEADFIIIKNFLNQRSQPSSTTSRKKHSGNVTSDSRQQNSTTVVTEDGVCIEFVGNEPVFPEIPQHMRFSQADLANIAYAAMVMGCPDHKAFSTLSGNDRSAMFRFNPHFPVTKLERPSASERAHFEIANTFTYDRPSDRTLASQRARAQRQLEKMAARAEERLAEPSLPDLSTPISKDPQTTLGPNNCSHLPHRSMPSLTENGNFIDTIGSVRELPDSTESLSPQDLEKDRLHPSFRDEHVVCRSAQRGANNSPSHEKVKCPSKDKTSPRHRTKKDTSIFQENAARIAVGVQRVMRTLSPLHVDRLVRDSTIVDMLFVSAELCRILRAREKDNEIITRLQTKAEQLRNQWGVRADYLKEFSVLLSHVDAIRTALSDELALIDTSDENEMNGSLYSPDLQSPLDKLNCKPTKIDISSTNEYTTADSEGAQFFDRKKYLDEQEELTVLWKCGLQDYKAATSQSQRTTAVNRNHRALLEQLRLILEIANERAKRHYKARISDDTTHEFWSSEGTINAVQREVEMKAEALGLGRTTKAQVLALLLRLRYRELRHLAKSIGARSGRTKLDCARHILHHGLRLQEVEQLACMPHLIFDIKRTIDNFL